MQRIAIALLLSILAACSSEQAPRPAEFIPPQSAQVDFDNIRVYYNAVPTLALSAQTADSYQIKRSPDSALVVIAVRRHDGNDEMPAVGNVQVQIRDLTGQVRQSPELHPIETGNLIDYIGLVPVQSRDTLRFNVSLEADGRQRQFDFLRNF
ncbi:MAG: DUF4426 domain-containing protein [Xanthomonadaceae bacterium]|jgi:hypothetical protein|nr:DUF4426 domain-containing protein [Xanthomonadaceae bacterium]